MLEMIREYARETLEASEEAADIHLRHARYFCALAERLAPRLGGGGREPWLRRFDAELDNVRAALAWCLSHPDESDTGLRLAVALEGFWHFRYHWREAYDWVNALLIADQGMASVATRARALCLAGRLAVFLRDHTVARQHLDESIALARALGESHIEASALTWLARLGIQQQDGAAAHAYARESVVLFRRVGDTRELALALMYCAWAAHGDGQNDAARAAADESLALQRRIDNDWGIALVSDVLCRIALRQADLATAEAAAETSLALRRRAGAPFAIADSLDLRGQVAWRRGDLARARGPALRWRGIPGGRGASLPARQGRLLERNPRRSTLANLRTHSPESTDRENRKTIPSSTTPPGDTLPVSRSLRRDVLIHGARRYSLGCHLSARQRPPARAGAPGRPRPVAAGCAGRAALRRPPARLPGDAAPSTGD
jgi:hypothetical protein